MQKKLTLVLILLSMSLLACSSPEEKAASFIENAGLLYEEGNLNKSEIEYRNALQINQNLPDAWYGLARIYERRQEWRKAYAALNKIREIAPTHLDGRIKLGQILLASNQIDQALEDAREILEMGPDDARSHALMAAVQFRLENFKGAKEEVEKALAIDPGNTESKLVQARVLIAEKKHAEALRVLNKAISSNPDNVAFYLLKIQAYQELKDSRSVEKVYLTLADRFPENIAFKTALARQYVGAGDIDAAERVLEQIASADPANVGAKLDLVRFKYQHRSAGEAIALLKNYASSYKEEYRYYFMLGELYEAGGQTKEAAGVYREIIAADKLNASGLEARNKVALLELRAGNKDRARAMIDEVLAKDKANEGSLLMHAGFQMSEQKFDDAVVTVRTVLRDKPDSVKALALLGQAYAAMGSDELAVEAYTKAFQLNPGFPAVANSLATNMIRKRKFSEADEMLRESVARGNRSVEAVKLLAQVNLSLGKWDEAELLARQLQKIKGQEAVSQQVLGVVYQGKQEQEASIEAFKRAYELAPGSRQPIVALVRTYVRNGKTNEARRFLNSVIAVHAENITAHLLLGQLSLLEKNTPDAISNFRKVIEIDPEIGAGYLGLVAIFLRDNDLDKAETTVRQGLSKLPDHPVLSMNLAGIYERKGEFKQAIKTYESLLDKNPNLIVAKNNLASLLTDYAGDRAALEKARSIAAEFRTSRIPQFRDTYAWASVKSGTNLEEAIAILKGIVRENEQVDIYLYHLGEAYRVNGDSKNAATFLQKAVALAPPGSSIAQQARQSLQQLSQ